MLFAIDGVKLYAHSFTWNEALRSLLYMELSFMLIAIHEVWLCEALCSFRNMQ